MTRAMTPLQRYQADLARQGFVSDPAQAAAVTRLQQVHDELLARKPRRGAGGLSRRLSWPAVRGLYLWGGVGRGKTYLMDCFFESLPFSRKRRTHFHRFMQAVHEARRQYQNVQDPLAKVAADIAQDVRVLCFDEFFVSDIADAMILGRLLDVLFEHGVTLVATSNIEPDGLYSNGLQRDRFLPAIETLKRHVDVMHVDGGQDYRLRVLEQAEIFHYPLDAQADVNLQQYFRAIAQEEGVTEASLRLHDRDIPVRRMADGVLWMDFEAMCCGPRGVADYIEMARCYHTVLLSNVPALGRNLEDEARRFVNLVDEFYDRGVKLIISAAEPVESLYQGERSKFEFQRTASRLREMQSHQYLAQPHLP
jgi:cell division protein ZapE